VALEELEDISTEYLQHRVQIRLKYGLGKQVHRVDMEDGADIMEEELVMKQVLVEVLQRLY
jgi:hypothetical protein